VPSEIGIVTDDFVEEAASRFADADPGGPDWDALTEEQKDRFREALRAILLWLHARPKFH
jgi:hypothetical protein